MHRVRAQDARNKKVVEAFRRRGVTRLPALLAHGRAHVGCEMIEEYFRESAARAALGRPPVRGAARAHAAGDDYSTGAFASEDEDASNELDEFYQREIAMSGRGANIDMATWGEVGGSTAWGEEGD